MGIKDVINTALGNTIGFNLQRAGKNAGEAPMPMLYWKARKLLYFHELMKSIDAVEGDIVECGVGWGQSLYAFAISALVLNPERTIYGFDSFEGFPEPDTADATSAGAPRKGHYRTSESSVMTFLERSGVPQDFMENRIVLIKGFFNESLKQYPGKRIALLHIDADLYQSYLDCLNHFYPLVARGGIIAFDEYQDRAKYPGAKKAVDEFFMGRESLNRSTIVKRYYVVKE